METVLEDMYEALGAQWLSRAVKDVVSIQGSALVTPQVCVYHCLQKVKHALRNLKIFATRRSVLET